MDCAECGSPLPVAVGRGRPRKYCDEKCRNRARREYLREYGKRWRAENPDYAASWREQHPDYHREYDRKWRAENPDAAKAIARRTYLKHRDRHVEYRVAKRRGYDPASAETLEYRAILAGDPCSYCGGPSEQIDHIDPVAETGDNDWSNLTATCAWCNGPRRLLEIVFGCPT